MPVSDVPEGSANLRINAPMNNQEKGIRWAKAYVIPASAGKASPGGGLPATIDLGSG